MISAAKKWLLQDRIQGEDENRLAKTLLTIILIYWAGSSVILFLDLVWGDGSLWLLLLSGCILQLIPLFLLRQGKLPESSLATVGIYITFITIAATLGQGIHDYALIVYPVMIMFAGLAQKRRGMIFATGLTLAGTTWLAFGDMYGVYVPSIGTHATLFDYIILVIIIIVSNVAVQLLMEHLDFKNEQLRKELDERQTTERALQQSREMYRLLAENISDVIWIYDIIENRTRYISPSVERLRGYKPEEIMAGSMKSALTPDSFQYVQKSIASRLKDFQNGRREFYVDELEQICKDGSTVWTEVTANFQINPENGHVEIYGVSRDISEKRHAREALLVSEERIRQLVESAPYSIFDIHPDGTINFANAEAVNLLGYSKEELIGENVDILLPARYQDSHASLRKMYHESPYVRQIGTGNNLVAKHKDGTEIPVDIKLSYYQLKDTLQIIAFMQDISERKKAEKLLRESEAKFHAMFERHSAIMLLIEPVSGIILDANPSAEKFYGYSVEHLKTLFISDINMMPLDEIERQRLDALAYKKNYFIFPHRISNGEIRTVEIHSSPILLNGEQALFSIIHDITERKEAEEKLKESEARFRILFETMVQGVVFQSNSGAITSANPAAEHLLGLTLDQMQGRTSMDPRWRTIHEDGSELPGQEHPAMIALKTRQEVRNVVLGVYNPTLNDYRWINIHAVPQFKPGEQEAYQVYTTFDDVTERRKTDEALKASEMRYRLLAENISDVIWILDVNELRFRYVSPSVERLRGYTADEVLQQKLEEALTPQALQMFQEKLPIYVQEFLNGEAGFHVNEVEQPCKDGSTVWTEATTNFRINESNSHLEVYGVSRDITERKLNEHFLKQANHELQIHVKKVEQLSQELQEQAFRDPLTGLYNRRYLKESLQREFNRADRELFPISILIMDIDRFKNINDTYGHQVGDKFLIIIADLLKKNSRGSDITCRYGGEEFVLVLPETETQAAYTRAEQFRVEISKVHIPHEMKELSVTVSMGIAAYPEHSTIAEDLIVKADLALYQSKNNGRNRVTVWRETMQKNKI